MFLIDVAPTMGRMRQVEVAGTKPGESKIVEMTNLEWSLQFVMLKIQEMVRRTRLSFGQDFLTVGLDLSWQEDGPMWSDIVWI